DDGRRELSDMSKEQIGALVGQLEAEMRAAAKQLEFEKAASLRDEIQGIRQRVLEEDASTTVLRAAERAAGGARAARDAVAAGHGEGSVAPSKRMAAMRSGDRRGRRLAREADAGLEVTSVTVMEAGEEPGDTLDGAPHGHEDGRADADQGTAGDWLPGIRDEHEGDDSGWMARWIDRPTWDRRVTPNVVKRTGTRPRRRG
nr:UvrB/UvrC motif-containing protein [Chloroflexota bacterium]